MLQYLQNKLAKQPANNAHDRWLPGREKAGKIVQPNGKEDCKMSTMHST